MACVDQPRINLGELKLRIAKRIGFDRTQLYFSFLNRFLAQRLSKLEFNKLCLAALGQENVHLHNELIQSILNNASNTKIPPPLPSKQVKADRSVPITTPTPSPSPSPSVSFWSSGDLFLTSPKRRRSVGVFARRTKECPRLLQCNGVVNENGASGPDDLKRPVENHQDQSAEQPLKRLRMRSSLGIIVTEDEEEVVEQSSHYDMCSRRNPIRMPLGIPFCPTSVGGAQRPVTSVSYSSTVARSFDSGLLCHTEDLRKRMEELVRELGLEAVAIDCANLLNNGLDTYLKQIMVSCFQLVRSRLEQEPEKHMKAANCVSLETDVHGRSSSGSLDESIECKSRCQVSLWDFKVAMELNPMQLGENWPLILEKMSLFL